VNDYVAFGEKKVDLKQVAIPEIADIDF